MKYFLGTYEPALLPHGQMSLPRKIRDVIDSDSAILSVGFDRCVFGFSREGWEKIVAEGVDKPSYTVEGRQLRRQIFGSAEEVNLDNQGRIVVPMGLREYAQIKKDVVVVGAGDHFEIWAKEEWAKYSEMLKKNV